MHHFRQGRVREDRLHQLGFGEFALARDAVALDQLSDALARHVSAQ